MQILKRKSDNAGDKKLYACLIMDEMAIRKQIDWDHKKKTLIGYVENELPTHEHKRLPVAKQALVYLLNGVNERWKIPIAYFFVNGLTAEERGEITKAVITSLDSCGIQIIALTFDGITSNISMCKYLNNNNIFDNFLHPTYGYKIPIILDACHMIKLVRNTFASKEILYDGNGNTIRWEFIVKLVNLQNNGCFHLANKLTSRHIQWYKNKMNVKLAVQTLSESCAAALEQLYYDGHPDFTDCIATAQFCRIMNDTFDCLNSRNFYCSKFKKPLSKNNMKEIFSFFDISIKYLSSITLEVKGKPVIETISKTGFLGLIIDMKNVQFLFYEYIEKGYLEYILTYKLSQDHLEMFFSCIRAMGGYNNNPNVKQFLASYKRLLHHNEIKPSTQGNCIPLDNIPILNVSSHKTSSSNTERENENNEDENNNYMLIDDIPLLHINLANNHAITYIAGYIEKKIFNSIKCQMCYQLLNECKEVTSKFIDRKNCGFLRYPRIDTFTIVSAAEKIFNFFRINNKLNSLNAFNIMVSNTLRNIHLTALFNNFDLHSREVSQTFGVMEDHKFIIIKSIITLFFKIKFHYYGKQVTLKEHNTFIRHHFTKSIIFQGQ